MSGSQPDWWRQIWWYIQRSRLRIRHWTCSRWSDIKNKNQEDQNGDEDNSINAGEKSIHRNLEKEDHQEHYEE